jgi:hypothetical protein
MDQAREALELGATMLTYGGDLHFVRDALSRIREQFGALGIPFGEIAHGRGRTASPVV